MSRRRRKRRKTTSPGLKNLTNPVLAPTCPFISAPPRHATPEETPGERESRLSDFRLVVLALTESSVRPYKSPITAGALQNTKQVPALCNVAVPLATLGHVRKAKKSSRLTVRWGPGANPFHPKQLNPSMVAGRMYSYQFTATHWQPVQQKEFRDVGLARVRRDLGGLPIADLKELYRLWCSPELPSFGKETLINMLAEYFFSGTLLSERRDEEARVLKKTDVENLYFPLQCRQENGEIKSLTLPKDLMQSVLAFLSYNTVLLQSVGLVCWDWYVLVLSSWPHVKVTKTNVFAIPNLVLHATRSVLVNLGYGKTALEPSEITHLIQTLGDRVRIFDCQFDDPRPVKNLYQAMLGAKKHVSVRRFVLQRSNPERWTSAIFKVCFLSSFIHLMQAMPRFRKLKFPASELTSATVENFGHIVNARTLVELSFRFSVTSRSLSFIPASLPECPNLRRLHLSEGPEIENVTRYVRSAPSSRDVSRLQDWLRNHIARLTHLCVEVSNSTTFEEVFSFAPSNSAGLRLCVAVPSLVPSVLQFVASFSELEFLSLVGIAVSPSWGWGGIGATGVPTDFQTFILEDSLSMLRITDQCGKPMLDLVRNLGLNLEYLRLENARNQSGIVVFGDEVVVLYALGIQRDFLEEYLRYFPLENKSFFIRLREKPYYSGFGSGQTPDKLATGLLTDQVAFKELARSQVHWIQPQESAETDRRWRYNQMSSRRVHEYKGGVLFDDADVPKKYWKEARTWKQVPVHAAPGKSNLRWDVW